MAGYRRRVPMRRLVIVGAGGHGRVILDILSSIKGFEVAGFLDDDPKMQGKLVDGIPVIGNTKDSVKLKKASGIEAAVIAVGNNRIRASLFERFEKEGFALPAFVHPKSIVSVNARMGSGTVIMPGAIINTGARLGKDVCVNTGATVDHDCVIGDHAHLYPGANLAGGVRVGAFSYIGTNAAVNPYISIGDNAFIGTGAAVVEDMPGDVVAVGVPAKVIKKQAKV